MSEIICEWLNRELGLSKRVEPKSFAKEFATGYLIGEVLYKYQLQDDFDQFSQSRVVNAKLNNFTRMEPTFHLLGVPFDQNVARNIMSEQHGVATRLLYQMYIALQKKKKSGLTGVAMETMRPAAPAKLQSIGTEMYRERLKVMLPRQSDINLQHVTEQFDLKTKEMDEKIARIQNDELMKIQKVQEELRLQDIEKLRRARRRQNEIMARIQAAIVQIPKPPTNRTLKAVEAQKMLKKKKEAEEVYTEITRFEEAAKRNGSSSGMTLPARSPTFQRLRTTVSIGTAFLKMDSTDNYIRKIQKRLEEDTRAREQREKRRRRILMEQLVAHGAQEEAFREEQLINRLMRQSQQERRIAVQLMHVRHEKDVLRQNRIFREKQYEERREREFQEALDREAALQKQAKLDCEEQMRKVQELHDQIAADRAETRYTKHYLMCQEIMNQIIDLVTKTGEYRELTNSLIPIKLMREWKDLLFSGYPLYEEASIDPLPSEPTPQQLTELEKQDLLDDNDYEEYKTMAGEWSPQEDVNTKAPALNNNILGYVVRRLFEIISPPQAPTPPPVFPPFPIKGCILGKHYSGKSSSLEHLAQVYSIQVLSVDALVQEAIQANHDNEVEHVISVTGAEQEKDDKEDKIMKSSPLISNELATSVVESISKAKRNDQTEEEISQHQTMMSTKLEAALPKLSSRAQLGGAAEKYLKKGKGVPDELLLGILVEAINRIPANTGWVMDGFPITISQAKLFEKALTGVDPEKAAASSKKNKISSLVKDPMAPKDPPPPPPVLDFAVLIDVSDNVVLQRVAGQNVEIDTSVVHEDEPSNIGVPKGEDKNQVIDQIQHRITGFIDHWPKLETWFSVQQNILIRVNGEIEEALLFKKIEEVFLTTIVNKQKTGKEVEKKEEKPPPAPAPPPTPPDTTKDIHPTSTQKATSGKKEGRESKSSKDKENKTETPREKDSAKKPPKSGSSRGRSPGKKTKSAPASPEPTAPTPVGPPPIQPGSPEWVYVNEPLPQEIPEFLVPYWKSIEGNYENTIKAVLRNLRDERQIEIHYLYDIRSKFKDYLKCPDYKQEFVSQWQSDFNSVAEDMWKDEETKAELHQRVNDLRDCLWDICDNRKEEGEQERSDIMNDGWLQDHIGILVNHLFSLMQVEVDRFQDTMRLLCDYYKGMEGKIPAETNQDFARIPLLDLVNTNSHAESEKPKRIPLVPRRAQSPEQNASKHKSRAPQMKGKDDPSLEISGQICDADRKFITDTWQAAITSITNMVALEIQQTEAEEEKEQQILDMREKERLRASQASVKGSKKKPPKSPNRKKDPAASTPALPTPEESAELQRKQELKLKIKQEYFAALEYEEAATKSRLELIKSRTMDLRHDIVSRSEDAYKDMEKLLGSRFLAEMSSVDQLILVARHHIETSTRIEYQLVLEKTDFYISSDIKVIPDPVPPPRPLSVDISINATLTIPQLNKLYQQFLQMAPEGLISDTLFTEILLDLTTINLGVNTLPDVWMHLTLSEIQDMALALSPNSDVINWRSFVLSAMIPWPYPSLTQLLKTLQRFKAVDDNGCGTVTQEAYNQVELWFTGNADGYIPENPTEPLPFNRLDHLIEFFFSLFSDQKKNPPQLDYTEMLLYFASHADPTEGIYRALSVATGKAILKISEDNILLKSLPTIDPLEGSEVETAEKEDELLQNSEEVTITMQEFLRVFQRGASKDGDNHRFYPEEKEADNYSKLIIDTFKELGSENLEPVAVNDLLKHPVFQELIENCQLYKFTDIHGIIYKIKQMQPNDGEILTSSSN
ncbi:sperm flagellar protein 2 isoform X2 [Ascaphus truei]|uniref:sperm flagellar protein 2 isoform X2 n=1 Tax=Ascaphus truei TaxID=8439 RepID=UPI003F5A31C7